MAKRKVQGDVRNTIIENFLQLAHEEGVHMVTLQKVSKKAGLAYSSVHYYFGNSQDELLQASFEYANNKSNIYMQGIMQKSFSDLKSNAFHNFIRAKFDWSKQFPSFASLLGFFTYLCTRGGKERVLNNQIELQSQDFLRSCLLYEIGKGTYRRPKNLDNVLKNIHRILAAEFTFNLTMGKKTKVDLLIEEIEGQFL